jgi:hypothetical protein
VRARNHCAKALSFWNRRKMPLSTPVNPCQPLSDPATLAAMILAHPFAITDFIGLLPPHSLSATVNARLLPLS